MALLAAAWGASLSLAGGVLRRRALGSSGAMGVYAAGVALCLACAGLGTALLQSDFSLRYVASLTAANLPDLYKLSAFWAGPSGSLLLWTTVLALVSSAALAMNRRRHRDLMPWVAFALSALLLFFIAALAFGSNPFERLPFPPSEGRGLEAQLQNAAMALHPPLLILGYAASAVPFAFAIAGLVERRFDDAWLAVVLRWSAFAWSALTGGVTFGMFWAYREIAWGGYWSGDAMEIVSALPWLTGALLVLAKLSRSPIAARRAPIVALAAFTFTLAVAGTFVARSGIVPSAHAFVFSAAGPWFGALVGGVLVVTAALAYRARAAFRDVPVELAPTVEAGLSRVGRLVIFSGFAIFAVGLMGSAFGKEYAASLGDGESFRAKDAFGREWTFTSQGMSRYQRDNRAVMSVALLPSLAGRRLPFIKPEQRQFFDSEAKDLGEPVPKASVQSLLSQDIFVILTDTRLEKANLKIRFHPLISLLWVGGALMTLGGLLAFVADPRVPEASVEPAADVDARRLDEAAELAISRWRAPAMTCPSCGPRAEPDAAFCSNCGLPLSEA